MLRKGLSVAQCVGGESCQNAQFGSSREHLIRMERGRIDSEESALPELSPYRHQSRCLPQGNVPGRCLPSTCRSAGIRRPMDKAFLPDPARCKLPLCFIGQTLARPPGVRQSVRVGHLNHGKLFASLEVTAESFWMPPVRPF